MIKEPTGLYTYKVEMIIQILAKDEKTAKEKLDREGGYVSSREVSLLNSINLHPKADK